MTVPMKRNRLQLLLILVLAATVSGQPGCEAEVEGLTGKEKPGLDPPVDRFFFPTGLALTPDGRFLFVSNGNSDLKYNGGSIVVVDVEEALTRVLDPSAYEGSCRYGPQDIQVAECQEGVAQDPEGDEIPGLIRRDLTVRTGFMRRLATTGRSSRSQPSLRLR